MNSNLMIMAAGVSSRMKRSAEIDGSSHAAIEALSKPKMMLNVGGRPFLDYLLFNARDAGYSDILFIVSDRDDTIRNYYTENAGDEQFTSLTFSFAEQTIPKGHSKPLGTADAALSGLEFRPDWAGQKFTVCNSDNLYSVGALSDLKRDDHLSALIDYDRDALGVEPERVNAFAVIWKNGDGFLADIVEKPDAQQVEKATDGDGRVGVSMNVFRLDYNTILPLLKETPLHSEREEKELTETVRMLVKRVPSGMYAIPLSEPVPDLTTIGDIGQVGSFISSSS